MPGSAPRSLSLSAYTAEVGIAALSMFGLVWSALNFESAFHQVDAVGVFFYSVLVFMFASTFSRTMRRLP